MPVKYPPLASPDEVFERLGRESAGDVEDTRAEALLDSVSIKARRETGRLWLVLGPDGLTPATPYKVDPDLPGIVWDIVVTAVERALRNPDGFSSESAGDYSYQRVGIPGGVGGTYLTEGEIEILRGFRPSADSSVGGLRTLSTTRNEWVDETIWVGTRPGTQPFPLYSRDDFNV